jgi:hypothetical protein
VLNDYFNHVGFINNFQANVDGLTIEDIRSIAAKYGKVTEKEIKADGF